MGHNQIYNLNKMKRQPMDWEKIFANDVTDKGLISKIYKQFIQFNNNNKNTLGSSWCGTKGVMTAWEHWDAASTPGLAE